jgi:alpha-galactosidase
MGNPGSATPALLDDVAGVIPAITRIRVDPGTTLATSTLGPAVIELTASAAGGRPALQVQVDLADAVGYWHPDRRSMRALPPDWTEPTVTSLINSAPIGAVYNAAGEVLLGWAAGDGVTELSVRFGVSEQHKSFDVEVRSVRRRDTDLVVVLDGARDGLADTVRRLVRWLSARCAGTVLEPPAVAREPVYSTWYTFTQDIDAELVTTEAALAAELGCGSVFIDDGWQRHGRGRGYQGCGDWVPDEVKFPDLAATVERIHGHGAGVALWIAPLLIGREGAAYADLGRFAPRGMAGLNCQVLDPRHAEVRAHVVQTCLRLVRDHGVDLLKIDFLDTAMEYGDADGSGDIPDVGRAVADMLGQLRGRLVEVGRPDVAFEFRQPYVSPAVARFGEILRANDCPADSVVNRLETLDARLMSVGQIVHADPMMWGPAGGAEAVAQQLYAGWFAVPQISMQLSALPEAQRTALRGLLDLWRSQADVTLDGVLELRGAEHGYDLVRAARVDLDRTVIVRYAPITVELDERSTGEVTIINATPADKLVLRTARPITGIVVRSAAAEGTSMPLAAGPGLVELAVPPYGSVTLQS